MPSRDVSELKRINEELKREIMERKKAEAGMEQRNRLLLTLLDVSNLVSSVLELRPLLEAILDKLRTIIEYNGAKFFILDGELLRVVAHRSSLGKEEEKGYSFNFNDVPLGEEIIFNKKPVIIPDIYGDTGTAADFRGKLAAYLETSLKNVRSWIGIPLIIKDRVIGVLTIDHTKPGFYQQQHVELGMAFANQAALEFENARLYNETVKRADELKTMFSVQQAITSRLNLRDVIKLISDEARRLTNSDKTAVFMVEGRELVLSVYSGKVGDSLLGYRLPIESTYGGKVLLSGKPVIINNASEYPSIYSGLLEKVGVSSLLSVPLISDSRPIGMIGAADKKGGLYNEDDVRILSMLASIAVIGLENARLYEEERKRHLEDQNRRYVAEGLREILSILNSNRSLNVIFEFLINQAARMLGADGCALYRLGEDGVSLEAEASSMLSESCLESCMPVAGLQEIARSISQRAPAAVSLANIKPGCSECFETVLYVPLICNDDIYGCIVLCYKKSRSFSKDETELAMIFSDQAALAIDNARLRKQAEELAVAAERSRIARDLHDAVTQTLFSASLLAEVLPKIWERDGGEGRKRLEELRQLTRGALAEMRTLLLELRPATLVEAGLEELLKHLAEATAGRARIPVELAAEECSLLPVDVKIGLYRIAQEALNNVAKHSGASRAQVAVKCVKAGGTDGKVNSVELVITDDGRGFDPQLIKGDHLGLGIMKERAAALNGRLEITSTPGKGTRVAISWLGRSDHSPSSSL